MYSHTLNKKWQEFLYAFSGFGPNFLMVLMGAYFTDAINPAAMGAGQTYQVISSGVCFILPGIFPVLFTISKAFDGIIDIPFAHITDSLSTKWGKRRPVILVCLLPMIISYLMCWIPVGGAENPLFNSIWIFIWSLIFFSSYTMCLIAFYGSMSNTCKDEPQRLRVSGYKSFFDTISYCIVYALVPVILESAKIHIDTFVFITSPLMLTMIIPLVLIKEGEKYGYPETKGGTAPKISMKESIVLTFKNRIFLSWVAVNCCTFFGLQMFLVAMNAMIIGGMGFNGLEMALANTCAFGPVPIMLYLFNKVKAKKGVRFTYQTCLIAFAVAIMSFFFASLFVTGGNKPLQYIIICIGSVIGSWSIGTFFMMPYLAASQISVVEEELTGKNHSAMYFAANALTSSIVGAISSNLLYDNIKNFFITKEFTKPVWAQTPKEAASIFGVGVDEVYNFGTLIIPFIVAIVCIAGFFLAFKMPRDFTSLAIAKELARFDKSIDLSRVKHEDNKSEKGEIIFVQVGLSILSGFIFGFIWVGLLFNSAKEFVKEKLNALHWLLACFVPFASLFVTLKIHKQFIERGRELGVIIKDRSVLIIVFSILLPILPVNTVVLGILQSNMNKLYQLETN